MPPRSVMNSRRCIPAPKLRRQHCIGSQEYFDRGLKPASKPLPQCTANVAVGSKADKPSQAKIQICPLLSESGQDFSPPASKASWSSFPTEECDHARQSQFRTTGTQVDALEQGETDRRQATATAETRLGDPDQTPDRATNPRSGIVQSGHRQQIARLRCRRSQGRGRCSEWLLCRTGNRAPEKDRATSPV